MKINYRALSVLAWFVGVLAFTCILAACVLFGFSFCGLSWNTFLDCIYRVYYATY